jgi:hypothetical protein
MHDLYYRASSDKKNYYIGCWLVHASSGNSPQNFFVRVISVLHWDDKPLNFYYCLRSVQLGLERLASSDEAIRSAISLLYMDGWLFYLYTKVSSYFLFLSLSRARIIAQAKANNKYVWIKLIQPAMHGCLFVIYVIISNILIRACIHHYLGNKESSYRQSSDDDGLVVTHIDNIQLLMPSYE